MESTFKLFRVRGIEIGVNWSWLFIFVLVAWSLGAAVLPQSHPGLESEVYIGMGIVAAILFFTSILLHELGHAFQALKEGMQIDGITLWLLGGVARFRSMFPSAGAEFRIAVAGPVVTLVLAGIFTVLNWAGSAFAWPGAFVGVVDWLARINIIVLVFNMLPALPLDGGRVLRSYLWGRHGSFSVATVSAARAGKTFGGFLIAVGLLGFITGLAVGGLWFAVIGWFIMQAAGAEQQFALVRKAIGGLQVRDLMTPEPDVVSPNLTVLEFLDDVARVRGHSTYPVVDSFGRLAGLASLRRAGQVTPDERSMRTIHDIMLSGDETPTLSPDLDAVDALERLQQGPGRAVVLDDGEIVGIVSINDVARTLKIEQLRGDREPKPPGARRSSLLVGVLVGVMILAAGGYIYHPPVAVLAPGETIDVTDDITIEGTESHEISGAYMLTSVRVHQPNVFGVAMAFARDRDVIPMDALIPSDVDPEEWIEEQQSLFDQSQMVAAAAAAQSAGMEVDITGTGARVLGVIEGTPASDVLSSDDVILAVNGEEVALAADLQDEIRAHPAGTEFTLTVERDGEEIKVDVASAQLEAGEGAAGIGVWIETRDMDVGLPFEVSFADREIGGPSAGLAYALAVHDLLVSEDLADGRAVAATGQIEMDGRVRRVGGVDAKAISVRDAGGDLFLVPSSEVDAARGVGISVRGVDSLDEAIRSLRGSS